MPNALQAIMSSQFFGKSHSQWLMYAGTEVPSKLTCLINIEQDLAIGATVQAIGMTSIKPHAAVGIEADLAYARLTSPLRDR